MNYKYLEINQRLIIDYGITCYLIETYTYVWTYKLSSGPGYDKLSVFGIISLTMILLL